MNDFPGPASSSPPTLAGPAKERPGRRPGLGIYPHIFSRGLTHRARSAIGQPAHRGGLIGAPAHSSLYALYEILTVNAMCKPRCRTVASTGPMVRPVEAIAPDGRALPSSAAWRKRGGDQAKGRG